MARTIGEKLSEYARLMNEYGVDSTEATRFIEDHERSGQDTEFLELAEISRRLKIELQPKPQDDPQQDAQREEQPDRA
jgi:hypothetical protein